MTVTKFIRTSQPQGPCEISPLWKHRKFASLIVGSTRSVELISGKPVTYEAVGTGLAPTISSSPNGVAIAGNYVDNANGGRINAPYPSRPITGDVTLIFVGGNLPNTSNGTTLFGVRSTTTATPTIQLDCIIGNIRFVVRDDANVLALISATGAATYTGSKVVIARRKGVNLDIWINGVVAASSSAGPTGILTVDSFGIFAIQAGTTSWTATSPAKAELLGVVSEALPDLEIKELSKNPWQLFTPISRPIFVGATSTVVSISRPTADVTTSGWTGNPDNVNLFTNINETTPSNTEFIESPNISGGEFTTFDFLPTRPSGTWDVTYHARFTGASAQARIHLLDGSGVSQGVSAWQTVTSTFDPYVASVTTTGTSSRVKIEVQ